MAFVSRASAFDRVIDGLERAGCRPTGVEKRMALCPVHEGDGARHNPSLSIGQGREGAVLKCFAGCPTEEVVARIGLQMADLFDEPPETVTAQRRIVAHYDYVDRDGQLLFQTVRYDPKDFRQRQPDGQGGWVWNLNGVELVPYHLPEVIEAVSVGGNVFIAEGEKDVEALQREGFVATCNPMGAVKWRDEYAQPLVGAGQVFVVADRDPAGYRHAEQVAASCRRAGLEVVVAEPRDGFKDVAEHLGAGHAVEDLVVVDDDRLRKLGGAGATLSLATSTSDVPPGSMPGGRPSGRGKEKNWPDLSPTACYGLAGEIIRGLHPYTESDLAAMLVSFLVGVGNAVGSTPHAVADAAMHPPRLNAVIVGETAKARKGTSWRNVKRILTEADRFWPARIKSGLSSGEGLINQVGDPVYGTDGKVKTPGSSDKRLLVVEEEFARVLIAARRETNTLSAIIRQAWDDGCLRVLTKESQEATDAHISILGHITLEELKVKPY